MKSASIRVRLTVWYFLVLALILCLFGAGTFWAVRRTIDTAVDDELRLRLQGLQRFMLRIIPGNTLAEIHEEFEESSDLKPGDLVQISDAQGSWIFQSASIRPYQIAAANLDGVEIKTIVAESDPLRMLTARVDVKGVPYSVQVATPLSGFYAMLHRFGWLLVWSIPAVLLISTAAGYWLSRRALAPVDEITNTARSLGALDLTRRLSVPRTGDELQRLSETLNQMIGRLEAAFRKNTQFTGDASHELRTPISVIRTTAELALRRNRTTQDYEHALQQILNEAERTSALIENLMMLARADSGAEVLHLTGVNLRESLEEACLQGRLLAGPRQVQFAWEIPDRELPVKGDPGALRRLFLILIDNALKYTPASGRVSVSVERNDGFVTGEVRDTGIGIAPEDLPNIFERFYRADRARSRDLGGAGLGLAIARWIADAHGASIQVESAPGQGSVFRVRIPLNR
jgi:heavy metal sensor kinase